MRTARRAFGSLAAFTVGVSAISPVFAQSVQQTFDKIEQMQKQGCLLYTSPSPRDATLSRMPSSA